LNALSERQLRTTLLGAFIVLSWLALWAWSRTPEGRHFHHAAVGAGASFVFGWTLMTIAMMLPTAFPLLGLFHRMVDARRHGAFLVGLCIAGYLTVWLIFGAAANFGVFYLYPILTGVDFQAALLVAAGIYQFTPLKRYCLKKCRSPLSFIMSHWRGRNEARESFWLGAHHGLFCIGCCWSLMLLMFAAIAVHFLWMLVLGTVMAVEKNVPWGERISAPLGVLLIAGAIVVKATG